MRIFQYPVSLVSLTFWFLFWFLNALDKFLAQQHMGMIRWYGNHRVEKFGMYFERLDIDSTYVVPTLVFAGIVEFAVAALFGVAIWRLVKSGGDVLGAISSAVAASIVIFIGFEIFDVVVGDRAELLEHSTYIGVLFLSYLVSLFELQRKVPAT
ncbi:MAG: hypothetical protein HWE23_00870 [Rhodobacteraceae bacterium]|nr:hypothetical protein [Paracoccaceae bacterium]